MVLTNDTELILSYTYIVTIEGVLLVDCFSNYAGHAASEETETAIPTET